MCIFRDAVKILNVFSAQERLITSLGIHFHSPHCPSLPSFQLLLLPSVPPTLLLSSFPSYYSSENRKMMISKYWFRALKDEQSVSALTSKGSKIVLHSPSLHYSLLYEVNCSLIKLLTLDFP